MTYKEYPGYTKCYIVVHKTGFGVMEAPYEEKEVCGEFDDLKEAQDKTNELRTQNNTADDLKGSWIPNTYWVNVNTLSEWGMKLLERFDYEFTDKLKKGLEEDKYEIYEHNGNTYYFDKSMEKMWRDKNDGSALMSVSHHILDLSKKEGE